MLRSLRLVRSLPLVLAAAFAHDRALAGLPCGGSTISADVAVVSVTTGGVQNLALDVSPAEAAMQWHVVGSFAGTTPGEPNLALGGLLLNSDRYLYAMLTGTSPLGRPLEAFKHPQFTDDGEELYMVARGARTDAAAKGPQETYRVYRLPGARQLQQAFAKLR